jgi:arginine repressor
VNELAPDYLPKTGSLSHGDKVSIARAIKERLEREGINATESTVARYLRQGW